MLIFQRGLAQLWESWNIPSSNGNDEVHGHEQDALKPMGLAVSNEVVNQQDSDEENDHLEGVEVEGLKTNQHIILTSKSSTAENGQETNHIMNPNNPPQNNNQRQHQQRNLHT